MRFVRTQPQAPTLVTTKGTYVNSKGKTTHHPPGKYSAHAERKPTEIKFIGVDGEGMNVKGVHRYVLFGVGEKQIEDSGGLRWTDCFSYLYGIHGSNGGRDTAYVGFFLGYDFTQIFKTLPEDRARMLLTKEGIALRQHRSRVNGTLQRTGRPGMPPHPVEHEGWQFDMLGYKRLKLRPKLCDCEVASCKCPGKQPWMYICDVGSFFQSSFLKVIDPKGWADGTEVVTPNEWKIIKTGKEKRSTAILDDEMRMYNALENTVLSRVMATLNTGFQDIGIRLSPKQWFGPGQAAQTWLKNEGVATREELGSVIPLRMSEAARASYYGGWFEIMMHGIIPGDSHEYDINSAYPSIIKDLPCLLHGTYTHGDGPPPMESSGHAGSLTLVYADVESPCVGSTWKYKGQHIGAMLHRDAKGNISRPMSTEGWFWFDELQAANRAGLVKKTSLQKIQKWVSYEPCGCEPPMAKVADLYEKRLQVGKTSPLGKAAKLVYNSGYGKFAQSEGLNPLFGNPIYASRITSGCRRMILDAIATHPYGKEDVAMVATDAVYFLHPHPSLSISEKLGEWDYKKRTNLTLFKPGVYWDDSVRKSISDGENPNFKARGFKASDFIAALTRIDSEFKSWDDISDDRIAQLNRANKSLPDVRAKSQWHWPSVKFIPSFMMTTALQALQRNKWELAGTVMDETTAKPLEQNADPFTKRDGIRRDNYRGRMIYRSSPRGVTFEPSQPYAKRFGMEDPWSDEARAQWGETMEGKMTDILTWILNGE